MDHVWQALLLGIIEGLTEFLPVSSTGHLVLTGKLIGVDLESDAVKAFEISIQLGAILAVCLVYWRKLTSTVLGLRSDRRAQLFTRNVLIGFLPAMVIGVFAYKYIKQLLESPITVSVMLILGGLAIIAIERINKNPRHHEVEAFPALLSLKIGLFQCMAMVPGVSRSGATIMGSLLMGVDRKAATEYSFFLAVPTMVAATVYALYKNWTHLDFGQGWLIAIGFVAAFFAALVVVRAAIAFISRHGFTPFAIYRIIVGVVMLFVLI